MKKRARWSPGRSSRIAGIVALMLLAGLIPGSAAAVTSQRADVTLRYACRFPSGSEQVPMRIRGTFPGSTEAGSKIQPRQVSVAAAVPRQALQGLADGAPVEGVAGLQVMKSQKKRPIGTPWEGLTIPDTKVPGNDTVTLTATGPVPPAVVAARGGQVVFSAGKLSLKLSTNGADGKSPKSIAVSCTPNLGQDATLVAIPLLEAQRAPVQTQPPNATGSVAPRAQAGEGDFCEIPFPSTEYNPKLIKYFPEEPVGFPLNSPDRACGRLDGKSNVNKLKGAAKVTAGVSVNAVVQQWFYVKNGTLYNQQRHTAMSRVDVTEATFLTFGFMPTTAKMEITQIGNMNMLTDGPVNVNEPGAPPVINNSWSLVSIRIFDVRVNGTPMDVGPNCRTVRPTLLALTGRNDTNPPYSLEGGGLLTGKVDVPAFSGCGVGEDLDRLFTASVSGENNVVRLTQGPFCYTNSSTLLNPCPPADGYGFSITPGGEWSSTSGPVSINPSVNAPQDSRSIIECASSTLTGRFRSGTLIGQGDLGEITGLTLRSCQGGGALSGVDFQDVSVQGLPQTIGATGAGLGFDPRTEVLKVRIEDWKFNFSSPSCDFSLGGAGGTPTRPSFTHTRSTGEISFADIGDMRVLNPEGCPFSRFSVAGTPQPWVYPGVHQDFGYGESFD